jgi:hypothetical protein
MAIPGDIRDREIKKFVESPTRPNETAIETIVSGVFDPPIQADAITREESGNSEIYKYRQGGIAGTVLKTVTVTYTAPNFKTLLNVVVS